MIASLRSSCSDLSWPIFADEFHKSAYEQADMIVGSVDEVLMSDRPSWRAVSPSTVL